MEVTIFPGIPEAEPPGRKIMVDFLWKFKPDLKLERVLRWMYQLKKFKLQVVLCHRIDKSKKQRTQ